MKRSYAEYIPQQRISMVRLQWPTVVVAAMRPEGRQYQEELGGIYPTAAHTYGALAVAYCCDGRDAA